MTEAMRGKRKTLAGPSGFGALAGAPLGEAGLEKSVNVRKLSSGTEALYVEKQSSLTQTIAQT